MKKLLLIALLPLALGPAGYVAGRFLLPALNSGAGDARAGSAPREMLYEMPLGKFIIQVMKPDKILHIQIDMDVYIAGAMSFERLNGARGRALLRDATIAAVSDLAETVLWIDDGAEDQLNKGVLADQVVHKINRSFAAVRAARINDLMAYHSARR